MTVQGTTVLVTGGAGFIGSHLTEALVGENDVRVLDDCSTGQPENVPRGAELIQGDIRDGAVLDRAVAGVDVMVHLAAMVSVPESVEHPQTCHAINAGATVDLLERARAEGTRVVFASTAAIYGRPDSVPIGETDRKEPESPYGISKLGADHVVRRYHDLYGLETVVVRFFNVYGPGHSGGAYSGVIDVFSAQAAAGEPLTVHGDGTQTRDFVHVSDVVRATMLAAGSDVSGEAFNVGTGDSVQIRALAALIRDLVGSDSDIVHTDPRPGDIQESVADISKARSALDFEATVDLEEGLRELVTEAHR